MKRTRDTEPEFNLSPIEKVTLRARFEELRADPSVRTYTIEEIAKELGVPLRQSNNGHKAGTGRR